MLCYFISNKDKYEGICLEDYFEIGDEEVAGGNRC